MTMRTRLPLLATFAAFFLVLPYVTILRLDLKQFIPNNNSKNKKVAVVDHRLDVHQISSDRFFWGNNESIPFDATLTIDKEIGRICVEIDVNKSLCPFPNLRVRLSGSALVNMNANGCVLAPVAGLYYLDANILHCTMHVLPNTTSGQLKRMCPLQPKIDKRVQDFSFVIPPFSRKKQSTMMSYGWSYRTWIHECIMEKGTCDGLSMMRTVFQTQEYLAVYGYDALENASQFLERFDPYVFVEVDLATGKPNRHDPFLSTTSFSRTIPGLTKEVLEQKQTKICIVGDSHGRHLSHALHALLQDQKRNGFDLCRHWVVPLTQAQFATKPGGISYEFMTYPEQGIQGVSTIIVNSCDVIVLVLGHWDAGFPRRRPTVPSAFVAQTRVMLESMENVTKATTKIYVSTVNQHPLGYRSLGCEDWRVPSLINLYNQYLHNETTRHSTEQARFLYPFRDLNKTFLLDNTDIMDAVWDSATDWVHPCRMATAPMGQRLAWLIQEYLDHS